MRRARPRDLDDAVVARQAGRAQRAEEVRDGDAGDGGERLAVGGGEDDVLGPQPEVDVHDGGAGGDGRRARGEDVDDDAGAHRRADGHRGHVHALGCDEVLDEAALAGVVGDVLDAPEDLAVLEGWDVGGNERPGG